MPSSAPPPMPSASPSCPPPFAYKRASPSRRSTSLAIFLSHPLSSSPKETRREHKPTASSAPGRQTAPPRTLRRPGRTGELLSPPLASLHILEPSLLFPSLNFAIHRRNPAAPSSSSVPARSAKSTAVSSPVIPGSIPRTWSLHASPPTSFNRQLELSPTRSPPPRQALRAATDFRRQLASDSLSAAQPHRPGRRTTLPYRHRPPEAAPPPPKEPPWRHGSVLATSGHRC